MTAPTTALAAPATRALDIGSTVIKLAQLDGQGGLASQEFFPRDFKAGIARQVRAVLEQRRIDPEREPMLVCSSANGGLRVGIVALSPIFSGATARNQVLLAGANPEYVLPLDDPRGDPRRVDVLLVVGGTDEVDAGPAAALLQAFDPGRYRFGTLVYAGNRHLAGHFSARFAQAHVIDNPLGETLSSRVGSVFETMRRAYLDDLVFKEGISELPPALTRSIRPTPEVASRGFLRSVNNQGSFAIVGGCLVIDIGGATTDLHYTVECVVEDSPVRPASGMSVARYVFTDLGIVASRDTLMLQLRAHPQLYEFLGSVLDGEHTREVYTGLREGENQASPQLMSYACLFLALERFAKGRGPGLPTGDLGTVAQTHPHRRRRADAGRTIVARMLGLLLPAGTCAPTGAGGSTLRDLGRGDHLDRRSTLQERARCKTHPSGRPGTRGAGRRWRPSTRRRCTCSTPSLSAAVCSASRPRSAALPACTTRSRPIPTWRCCARRPRYGDGADISSGGELYQALAAGFAAEQMSFAGPAKTDDELRAAIAAGVGCISVESLREIDACAASRPTCKLPARILLRVNPTQVHRAYGLKMGGRAGQFGIDEVHLPAAEARVRGHGAHLVCGGLHSYVGSQCFDGAGTLDATANALRLAQEFERRTGWPCRKLNLGGGFGVAQSGERRELMLDAVAADLRGLLQPFLQARPGCRILLRAGPFHHCAGRHLFHAGRRHQGLTRYRLRRLRRRTQPSARRGGHLRGCPAGQLPRAQSEPARGRADGVQHRRPVVQPDRSAGRAG